MIPRMSGIWLIEHGEYKPRIIADIQLDNCYIDTQMLLFLFSTLKTFFKEAGEVQIIKFTNIQIVFLEGNPCVAVATPPNEDERRVSEFGFEILRLLERIVEVEPRRGLDTEMYHARVIEQLVDEKSALYQNQWSVDSKLQRRRKEETWKVEPKRKKRFVDDWKVKFT